MDTLHSEGSGEWVDIEPSDSATSDIPQWKIESAPVNRASGLADLRPASRSGGSHLSTRTGGRQVVVDNSEQEADELQLQLLESKSAHIRDVQSMQQEITRLRQTLQDVRSQWNASQQSEEHAYGQLHATQAELSALRARYDDLDVRFASARASMAHPRTVDPLALDLQAQVQQLTRELGFAREQAQASAERQQGQQVDIARLQTENRAQLVKIHALSAQLSSVLEQDASESVRLHAAESQVHQLTAELDKRLSQVHKLVEALTRVKEREAATNAALEAQKSSLETVQRSLLSTSSECDRWRAAVTQLETQHDRDVQQIEELAARLESLQEKQSDDHCALSSAVESAEAVKALSVALEHSQEEVTQLRHALADAQAEGRKETLTSQRKVEEQAALISALQADLSAATAAVTFSLTSPSTAPHAFAGTSLGTGAASSAAMGSTLSPFSEKGKRRGQAGAESILHALLEGGGLPGDSESASLAATAASGGRGEARRGANDRSPMPDGKNREHHADSPSVAALTAEISRLRLQCESLSRRLTLRDEQVSDLEREQEELVEVNERLRSAVEEARASNNAGVSVPAVDQALSHADYLRKRPAAAGASATLPQPGTLPVPVPASGRPRQGQGGATVPSATDKEEQLVNVLQGQVRILELAFRLVLLHAWRTEGVCASARQLLTLVHGLLQQVRAHMQAGGSNTGAGMGDQHALSLLSGQGEAGHVQDPVLLAQTARLQAPLAQVFATLSAGGRGVTDGSPSLFKSISLPLPGQAGSGRTEGKERGYYGDIASLSEQVQHVLQLAHTDTAAFMAFIVKQIGPSAGADLKGSGVPLTLTDPILLRTLLVDCASQVQQVQGEIQEQAAASLGQACVTQ